MRRIAFFSCLLATAACQRGCSCDERGHDADAATQDATNDVESTATADSASQDAGVLLGGVADVTVYLGADAARFQHAAVFGDGEGLEVLLTTLPVACPGSPKPPTPYLSFPIHPGPGGRWFAGSTVGTEVFLHFGEGREMLFESHLAKLAVAEFARDGGTRRIRGSLALDAPDAGAQGGAKGSGESAKATGTFEGAICTADDAPENVEERATPLPLTAPKQRLTVSYGKTSVVMESAVANVEEESRPPYLREIVVSFVRPELLANEPVPPSAHLDMTITLQGATGRDQKTLFATPQPVHAELGGRSGASHHGRGASHARGFGPPVWHGSGPGWIRITRADMRSGGRIEGELVVQLGQFPQAVTAGGTFVATVD